MAAKHVATAPPEPAPLAAPATLVGRLPPLLLAGASAAREIAGCPDLQAILIALATQGAAVGPAHRLECPGGEGFLYPTADLLLADGALLAAARSLLAPMLRRVAEIIFLHRGMSRRQILAELAERRDSRKACEIRLANMDKTLKGIDDSMKAGRIPYVAGIDFLRGFGDFRLREDRKGVLHELGALVCRETETFFALRPVIMTGGLSSGFLRRWAEATFDGHAVDLLPSGDAVASFLSTPAPSLDLVLRFLEGCGAGSPAFALGGDQHVGAAVSLLWACGAGDLGAILGHPAMTGGPLAARLFAVTPSAAESAAPAAPSSPGTAENLGLWGGYVQKNLFRVRLYDVRRTHRLCPKAAARHSEFERECLSASRGATDPRAGAHLRELPRSALRIALGLHVGTLAGVETGDVVADDTHAMAVEIARAASDAHFATLGEFPADLGRQPVIAEVDVMVAKLRLRGPCSRRDLYRTYHSQRTAELEPILGAAMREGLVTEDAGRLVATVPNPGRQRVSASAQAP
ncbi:MAG TPA: hypothetical protein PLU30_22825 [Verrucomicrobiae bacterium]|nr:hypothetical protein [Verrucomicrobiae bacterium]